MKFLKVKNLLFYFVFFLVLYFENINILGVIKLSQLWKLPIIIYCLSFFFKSKKNKKSLLINVIIINLIVCINIFLNTNIFYGISENISEIINVLTLPILIYFFISHFKYTPRKLLYFIQTLSFFLIISNIPFLLGLIEERNNSFNLSKFGFEDNSFALTGLFYHVSITSKILVVSVLVLVSKFLDYNSNKIDKLILLIVILLGVYFVYLTYTRLGWILLILGIFLIFFKKNKLHKLFKFIPIIFIVTFLLIDIVQQNESLQLRLKGSTTYRQNDNFDLNMLSSYRLQIGGLAITNQIESGFLDVLVGSGKKEAGIKMEKKMSRNYIAHNKFIEIFQYGGLLAVIFYFIYLTRLYNFIKSIKVLQNSYTFHLSTSLFIIFIICCIPSHGFPFWSDLIFAGVISYNYIISKTIL